MSDAPLVIDRSALASAKPECPHFGTCGGCQYQDIAYDSQLELKQAQLTQLLAETDIAHPATQRHSAGPYHYRNRIRLRIQRREGSLRFGYNIRASTEFLPITTCPISAPNLIPIADALVALAAENTDTAHWLSATAELELFTNHDLARTQLTFFVAPRTKAPQGSFARMMNLLQQQVPEVAGAAAMAFDPRTGPTGRALDTWGAPGLNYSVGDESYWVSRGGFFQINRFLIDKLVHLVCNGRQDNTAWDLFAGVGLFSRVLAKSFKQATAVEASSVASADLAGAFKKLGSQHRAVAKTTLDFLREAVTQRERPDLLVLDPPRAGAGLEACALIAKLAPHEIVYVSCDPTTLARDLRELQTKGYRIDELHLIDLFPQTFHIEAVVLLSLTPRT